VLAPPDGALTREGTVQLLVQPRNAELRVTLNGAPVDPWIENPRFGNMAHGRLQLAPGENVITVRAGSEEKRIEVTFRPFLPAGSGKVRDRRRVGFHTTAGEAPCTGCHRIAPPRAKGEGPVCRVCHGNVAEAQFVHGPIGADICMACHEERRKDPVSRFEIVDREAKFCLRCHREPRQWIGSPYVHGPAAVGQCTICHSPHGSPFRFQLHAPPPRLCPTCHEDFPSPDESPGVHLHGVPRGNGCVDCHDPHAAEFPYMLDRPAGQVCYQCHDEQIYADRKHPVNRHPVKGVPDPSRPGKEISCTSCHTPHGSPTRSLLRAASYLELCDRCHRF
jgi:predicted CXXCH cytochrome family protein